METLVLKDAVQDAIEDLRAAFAGHDVRLAADGQGGAWVEIAETPLGAVYEQESTFVAFQLQFNLPNADIYPMFVRADLRRRDGAALDEGMQVTSLEWPGEPQRSVVQLSRRTRGSAFAAQNAVQKVAKVLDWLNDR